MSLEGGEDMSAAVKNSKYDVIVVGGGNAGLCAALSAAEHGGSVLLVDKAPESDKGGNTKYTAFYKFTYKGKEDILSMVPDTPEDMRNRLADIPPYTTDMFYNDVMRVTHGRANPELLETVVNNSRPTINWLLSNGIEHELNNRAWFVYQDKIYFEPGSCLMPKNYGPGLVEMLMKVCQQKGVEIVFEAMVTKLLFDYTKGVQGVMLKTPEGAREFRANRGVILASGGFQASPEMRGKYLGAGWDIMKNRGTKYDTGECLSMALAMGAKTCGEWAGAHCTQVDAAGPDCDMGDGTFRSSYQFGIIVNAEGKRFLDEGADFRGNTYARYGREVLLQPHGWACQIFNHELVKKGLLEAMYNTGSSVVANTIEELAEQIEVDPVRLERTITEYNNAVQPGEFTPGTLDGKKTLGIDPPKSNWAIKLEPPYIAYPVTSGITFTFGGLETNKYGQVLDSVDNPIPGLYAVGEIQGFFYHNYAVATGLTRAAVFGRIGGAHIMGQAIV
jgi:tricarballylate dehydrogenase